MPRRIVSTVSIALITVFAIVFLAGGANDDKESLRQTFQINAVYYDTGHVEVSYLDKSGKTDSVVLEILGMEESFQKKFVGPEFVEIVQFPAIPKYGWQIHPVVFEIDHPDLGHVQLKTEIHALDEPVPPVIYGKR